MKSLESGTYFPDADVRLPGWRGRESKNDLAPEKLLPLRYQEPQKRRRIEPYSWEELELGVPETVFEPDGRNRVPDPRNYPFSAICSLVIVNAQNERFFGTGFLAGPRLVLTAGHNVFFHGEGFMRAITVYPGINGDRMSPPFGSTSATHFATVEAWARDADRQFDIGAIFLPTDLGGPAGFFAVAKLTDGTLRGLTSTVAGYPREPPELTLPADATTLWMQAAKLMVEPNRLLYTADTSIGQSGCPVIAVFPEKQDKYHAIGIHNTGFATFNAATRINEAVFSQIVQWRTKSDALP
jgi:V8-like Glu-specific endopeptidase